MAEPPDRLATLWQQLRGATSARIGMTRIGPALATRDHLAFQRAHAEARDAVHGALDPAPLAETIRSLGLDVLCLHSAAPDRQTYLARPDLGRRLDDASRAQLGEASHGHDLIFVIADGLSARAAANHALPVIEGARPVLQQNGCSIGPVAIVTQGRVAIGDDIGFALGGKLVVVFIGERPGLSAPDSLGIYLTWAPAPGRTDAERNCLSNVRPGGMSYAEAAARLVYLINEARRRQVTGIALKDETAPAALPST
jgi:ethanolamine ammonia-lyase small subunit